MQFDLLRRREFIMLLGGAAWPLAARAQQPMPVVGFLLIASASSTKDETEGFRRGLRETGHTEAQNVLIEYRWAEAQYVDYLDWLLISFIGAWR